MHLERFRDAPGQKERVPCGTLFAISLSGIPNLFRDSVMTCDGSEQVFFLAIDTDLPQPVIVAQAVMNGVIILIVVHRTIPRCPLDSAVILIPLRLIVTPKEHGVAICGVVAAVSTRLANFFVEAIEVPQPDQGLYLCPALIVHEKHVADELNLAITVTVDCLY